MDFKSEHIHGLPMAEGVYENLFEPDQSTDKKVFSILTTFYYVRLSQILHLALPKGEGNAAKAILGV